MRILLLGSGYIGTALLQAWRRSGDSFVVTTTRQERLEELQNFAQTEHSQIEQALVLHSSDQAALSKACQGCDAIVVTVAPRPGQSYEDCYLQTARNLVAVAPPTAQILYTSSTAVYGDHGGAIVDESSERRGKKILIATEDVYIQRPNTCILRLGGIHGPGRTLEQRAQRLSGRELPGDPEQRTNNSHRDLIVEAIESAIQVGATGLLNVVDPAHPSRRELYGPLCRSLGIPEPIWQGGQAGRGSHAVVQGRRLRDLLDPYLPYPDAQEYHSITVPVPPEQAYALYKGLKATDSFLVRALLSLRGLRGNEDALFTLFRQLEEDAPHCHLLGLIARPWTPSGSLYQEACDFRSFSLPNYAKITWDMRFSAAAEGCLISTCTRVACTDDASRRKFKLYWFFVRPFSGLLRHLILRMLAKAASKLRD